MRGRNKYVSSVRSCLKVLSELPESRDIIDGVRSTFDKSYNNYEVDKESGGAKQKVHRSERIRDSER